jgi:phosphatidylinositol glycan class S
LAFEPSRGHSTGFVKGSEDQKRLDQALDEASHGERDAEEVAKALIEEEKGQEGWQVDEEMMKVFVNTERWSLGEYTLQELIWHVKLISDSGSTNNPVLRFLLFVPSVHHRPMHLAVEGESF